MVQIIKIFCRDILIYINFEGLRRFFNRLRKHRAAFLLRSLKLLMPKLLTNQVMLMLPIQC